MSLPPSEKIIERKVCPISGKEFVVTDADIAFLEKISPVFNGNKYLLPSPTLCPDERRRRRLCFRNERHLYTRTCSATGQKIISYHKPEAPYPVFHRDYWFSDSHDPTKYGRVFDFGRSFFDQYADLIKTAPQMHLIQGVDNENSDYINHAGSCKHCYYIFDSDFNEKCLYSTRVAHCTDLQDCSFCFESQKCYECIQCRQSYGLFYSSFCQNCAESWFIDSCIGCKNCLFCCNLKNKQFCILNQQYTPEEYATKLTQFLQDQNIANKRTIFANLLRKNICRSYHGVQCENVSGDDLYHVKNVHSSFGMDECEDCRYCDLLNSSKNCYDVSSFGEQLSWVYDAETIGVNTSNVLFGFINVYNATNLFYCMVAMLGSRNCFGCVGIKKGDHLVFNASYSVQEYETLCSKIVDHMRSTGEWGEFFPHELSLFGYNETVANEYFPMTEEEVKKMPRFSQWKDNTIIDNSIMRGDTNTTEKPESYYPLSGLSSASRGWNWYSQVEKKFDRLSITPLPIQDYDEKKVGFETAQRNIDALLNGVIVCDVTKKPFKIVRQELPCYIENSIPIPTKHPDQRHIDRLKLKNPNFLHDRTCAECGIQISTTYAPDRTEKVVCEECYRKLVYL